MRSTNQLNSKVSSQAVETADALRKLYFVRVAFSMIWIALVVTVATTNTAIATILFIIYPAWDVVATFFDIKANLPTANKGPQYVNVGIGVLTTLAVIIALQHGIPEALIVFGVWAILTGFIQLILGIRRRNISRGNGP